jgi:hypothetical protein
MKHSIIFWRKGFASYKKSACGTLEGGDRKQVMLPKRRNHRRQKELLVIYLFLPAVSNQVALPRNKGAVDGILPLRSPFSVRENTLVLLRLAEAKVHNDMRCYSVEINITPEKMIIDNIPEPSAIKPV